MVGAKPRLEYVQLAEDGYVVVVVEEDSLKTTGEWDSGSQSAAKVHVPQGTRRADQEESDKVTD